MKMTNRLVCMILVMTMLLLPVSALSIGDITGDGTNNMMDVAALYRHVAGTAKLSDDTLAYADVDGNGDINIMDVASMYTAVSGKTDAKYPLTVPTEYMAAEEAATGKDIADYSDGIALPRLANADVTMMMSIDWAVLADRNTASEPVAQYHAVQMWDAVYAAQGGAFEIVRITENAQTEYMVTSTATSVAPDVVKLDYALSYPRWTAAGLTASVETYSNELGLGEQFKGDDVYNADFMESYFQWGGNTHAVVLSKEADKQYLVYNRTLFEQAGEKTPLDHWKNDTWNWTQFEKSIEGVADTANDVYGFSGWGLFPYLAPFEMITQDDQGKASLNIDHRYYMNYMNRVYELYRDSDAVAKNPEVLQQWKSLMPIGRVGMVMATKSEFKTMYRQAKLQGYHLEIAPVPAYDPIGQTVGTASAKVWGYAIPSGAKNPKAAASYIRLEALVTRNIEQATKGQTWFDQKLSDDELAMLEATANDPICVDPTRGIGNCYAMVDSYIVPPLYYSCEDGGVYAIFDAYRAYLQAEIDAFNAEL